MVGGKWPVAPPPRVMALHSSYDFKSHVSNKKVKHRSSSWDYTKYKSLLTVGEAIWIKNTHKIEAIWIKNTHKIEAIWIKNTHKIKLFE